MLADLKATSWDITYTISKGHRVSDCWGVINLLRHMNLLAGHPCALEAFSRKLDRKIAHQWGGNGSYWFGPLRFQSCNHFAGQAGVLGIASVKMVPDM